LAASIFRKAHQKVHSGGALLGQTENMARGKLQFLSGDEIRRIHETSVRVLEQVGIALESKSVAKMLLENGCTTSKDGKRILIPESAVKSALAKAPKSILLASRDGKHDIRIPDHDRLFVATGGEGVYIKDLLTGETRAPRTEDLAKFVRLADTLPQVDFAWFLVGAQDQPAHLKGLAEMKTGFSCTTKHIQSAAVDTTEARDILKLASILTNGPEELAKRPIFSAVQCPISPLTFEGGLVEGQVELSRAGIPVVSMSAAVAGLTAPVTIAGMLAEINAENLASLVISQTAMKGAPWIYSSDSVMGDLKTGSIDYGALESNLARTGAGQIGKFYGLPTMVAGIGLENGSLMLGRARDGVPAMVNMALVPSDLGSGLGGLDQAAGASFEQLVLDAWVWDLAKEFIRNFAADDLAISYETIRDGGLDGNFLGKRHTLSRFKQEFTAVSKPEAVFSGRGESEPRGQLLRKAKDEVSKLLSGKPEIVVTREELAAMDDFFESQM
jgi:trimethylamine--corrinoid protein Co-methyltransferase